MEDRYTDSLPKGIITAITPKPFNQHEFTCWFSVLRRNEMHGYQYSSNIENFLWNDQYYYDKQSFIDLNFKTSTKNLLALFPYEAQDTSLFSFII